MMESAVTPASPSSAAAVPRWLSLARGAAVVIAVWAVVVQIRLGVLLPPVFAVGLVFAAFIPFLRGNRPRVGLAAAGIAALAILGNVPSLVEELSHPSSAEAFILTLVATTAASVIVLAGGGAFLGWSPVPLRRVATGALAIIVLGSAAALASAAGVQSDAAAPMDLEVIAKRNEFRPSDLRAAAGTVGIWVDNQDGARHTFTIDELGVDLDIPGRSSRRIEFAADPGEYRAYCAVPGHGGMRVMFEVE